MSEIPAGSTLTVTIGRNVGTTPLEESMWDKFTARVLDVIATVDPDLTFTYNGVGEWDGTREDSRAIMAVNTKSVADIGAELHRVAKEFGQDAINLVTGVSELV